MLNLGGSSPVHSKLTILSTRNNARARTRRSTTGIITDQLDGRTNKTQHLRQKTRPAYRSQDYTTILIDKDRKNDSSRLKRSKMHDTVTKMHQMSNIAGEVGGGRAC